MNFARTGHYRFAATVKIRIIGIMLNFSGTANARKAAAAPNASQTAAALVLLRDATLVGVYLDGDAVTTTFRRTARQVVGLIGMGGIVVFDGNCSY
ncbi:hypothetical protein PP715_08930 [Ralstonia solanacearum]|uniref:hypothetical protein n=1 Tax=Ralstonia solanacearum TaxID=305 RepID=UPI000F622A62|nr:hypothetical protein [Ralstonia solanacearum]MBB6587773.1 hypothetical protein [Ralstonia solanacearum]MCG3576961.1 hypothetical protein [Ralstonia solanacearum]MCL9841937.1 hypothetical protein [Ralstonia solanacearum]MDB0536442.1 hypothetical protein [Ralstonia solanacearum]MDB0546291.1 hypothetical protein [Ralstonia solanacearum]